MCKLCFFSMNDSANGFSDYVPLVNLISVFFQIRDDYMNLQAKEVHLTFPPSYPYCPHPYIPRFTRCLTSPTLIPSCCLLCNEIALENELIALQYADNKGFCEDLTEGKFSFPVVHGVRADPSNRQILSEPRFSPQACQLTIITFPSHRNISNHHHRT
jgi:geranylgeranyl diphosphate synthase type 3